MNRAIDICTCTHHRDDHFLTVGTGDQAVENTCVECPCPRFIPHPQPNQSAITSEIKLSVELAVLAFLTTLGDVHQTSRFEKNDQIVLELPTGDVWTIGTPVWRHTKPPEQRLQNPAANSGGV